MTERDDGLAGATERFRRRAQREGLVDVAYCELDSPIGPLLAAATPAGLVRLAFLPAEDPDVVLDQLARRLSPRVLRVPRRLDRVRRELDQYFAGRRRDFDVELDWSLTTGQFRRQVLEACARIPYGAVATYKDMAGAAGNPLASRAAGGALGSNPIPVIVPCHRVLATGGGLGGYGGGLPIKRHLLRLEGALEE